MAATAGLAGTGTVDSTGSDILGISNGVTAVSVRCLSTSADTLLVNVPAIHGSAYMLLETGQSEWFRSGHANITTVNAKASSGTATLSWGVASII
jgi:hypothetical protein